MYALGMPELVLDVSQHYALRLGQLHNTFESSVNGCTTLSLSVSEPRRRKEGGPERKRRGLGARRGKKKA